MQECNIFVHVRRTLCIGLGMHMLAVVLCTCGGVGFFVQHAAIHTVSCTCPRVLCISSSAIVPGHPENSCLIATIVAIASLSDQSRTRFKLKKWS